MAQRAFDRSIGLSMKYAVEIMTWGYFMKTFIMVRIYTCAVHFSYLGHFNKLQSQYLKEVPRLRDPHKLLSEIAAGACIR